MPLASEIMGCSMMQKSSFLPLNDLKDTHKNRGQFCVNPVLVPLDNRRSRSRSSRLKKGVRTTTPMVVVAAISEDLVKIVRVEKPVTFKVRAVLTVRNKNKEDLKETIVRKLDAFTDQIGRNVVLELYSNIIDPKTRAPKKSKEAVLKDWSKKSNLKTERVNYIADILVDSEFGTPGAITITNKHQKEFFLESITIEGFACGPPYLPDETPAGLKSLREKELRILRGDGKGIRKLSDRIYDYDVYNDLDISAESRVEKPLPMYVPRDEQFEESKANAFSTGRLRAVLHNLLPSMVASISKKHDFKGFSQIDSLYSEGVLLKLGLQDDLVKKLPLPNLVTRLHESSQGGGLLKYDTPKILSTIAGVNPVSIAKLEVFPPLSQLDPEKYGPQESALREEHIAGYLNGMTALEEDKLFIIDYHDIYLPFLDRINALDGRKAYATRTIFYLNQSGTLMPVAIELSLPQALPGSESKRVVTPPVDATSNWMWQLAKAHVCSNDAGVHQLIHHWLRTHASMEPFILAAHRQLSAMHPIYKLLDPHMRYTLEINALARQNLINADGVIEACFTPGRYCMAVPDPSKPHGLKLLIEDYPYATDGLLIWEAIQKWVQTYVNRYYPDSDQICNDRELQAWYAESINVGHADLRHENWWPTLASAEDLTSVLTTIIWLTSAQHAALNFGQYPYGGYVPNRPTLMRRLIPDENDPEYISFLDDPQKYYLSALPSLLQSTKIMAVVDTLSTHSPDEEYIGERQQTSTWSGDAETVEAFYAFSAEIQRIEKE
ncbi:Lipase/lipooxygenase, PLAT/LH2, partial [Cynara cardunculus var. scolymus]